MLVQHHHDPGVFDADHCWACARQAGLLDHYRRVQQQEATLREDHPDGRGVLLSLTARGNQLLLDALPAWQEAQERAQSLVAEALLGLEAGKEAS